MTVAVIAEKPSVARDIARVLGADARGEGCLRGNGYIVTWAIGHLVALGQPQDVDPAWKTWRREQLPMLPRAWPLVVLPGTKDQYDAVKRVLGDTDVTGIVCATDAGREGELIFRLILEATGCRKPVRRLWISSLTPDAIRTGFKNLKDAHHYDGLGDAARGRAQADWLVGMNLSRAYTLWNGDTITVGRVQTPTLAMVVQRELEIRAFVPQDYCEVVATFSPPSSGSYAGTWFKAPADDVTPEAVKNGRRLPGDGVEAARVVERVRHAGRGAVASRTDERKRLPPPLLYDLTELQRHANRLFGFSAQKTLDIAQQLYEAKKLLSYPRTDSRHLSLDVAARLPAVVDAIAGSYAGLVAPGTGERPLGRRFVDDTKVSDHHAIIPTTTRADDTDLTADERRIYDLVCRRVLAAWHEDHEWTVTTIITAVLDDRFHTQGTQVVKPGWKVLELGTRGKAPRATRTDDDDEAEDQDLPPGLERGQPQTVTDVRPVKKQTRPPRRYTEATLLTAMETAGRSLDDKELSRAMKDTGLRTPATRAAIMEGLLARAYMEREGKVLKATDKGIHLVNVVHADVKSPAMTGQWESRLHAVQRGEQRLTEFMGGIEQYVRDVVGRVKAAPAAPPLAVAPPVTTTTTPGADRSSLSIDDLLHRVFKHPSFRTHQEDVCRAAVAGRDLLLVMPTGAGKSLCYQLPGLARGGTTLVVSPLIALMEDQVARLKQLGLRAERIHSGRDRTASRAVCVEYVAGRLDFLFIAPERLRVPGFPELLARRKPTLIAIDEAHCISHWGHDFRPDYRMLGERLPLLRPTPVMALTATATPRVQDDIVQQLGLRDGLRFIHGFRRDNIAIEVVEVPKPEREGVIRHLLEDSACRPAIVYTPTRKEAEATAALLKSVAPSSAYHAGMPSGERDEVQRGFLAGKVEVIVATIAFGMGVDKADIRTVVHTALPTSLEGYYQEIGRAGRDGKPSRAVLLHSYVDRRTHEFFLNLNYPEPRVLAKLRGLLSDEPQAMDDVRRRSRMDEDEFDRAMEKLWIHGGAQVDGDDLVRVGHDRWEKPYEAQRAHRKAQQDLMARFAQGRSCRMVAMVRHFGDKSDDGRPCGLCDVCSSSASVVQTYRKPTDDEQVALAKILAELARSRSPASGTVLRAVFPAGFDRDTYELLLAGLVRAHLVETTDDSFEKDGRNIPFQRLLLTPLGRTVQRAGLSEIPLPSAMKRTTKPGRKRKPGGGGKSTKPAVAPRTRTASPSLDHALRTWRSAVAKKRGVPAFRVLTDRALSAIATDKPRNEKALLAITGVGPATVKLHGTVILEIVKRDAAS